MNKPLEIKKDMCPIVPILSFIPLYVLVKILWVLVSIKFITPSWDILSLLNKVGSKEFVVLSDFVRDTAKDL